MLFEDNGQLWESFISMQKDLGTDFAIEIGAHAAEFSQEMCNLLDINALAIEANPAVFNKYRNEITDSRVSYLNYAISDSNGSVDFLVHDDNLAGNNSIKTRLGDHDFKSYTVESYTMDSLVEELGLSFKNAALWIDCEGANREVLLGASETLKLCSSIFIETEDISFWEDQWLTNDVVEFLESVGFKVFATEDIYDDQKNIIFIKETS